MQFNKNTAIYLQIADHLYDRILSGEWPDGSRIPSIRDLAIQLEVNPNTVTRTYALLQEEGILDNQRGIGYFTAAEARMRVLRHKRMLFLTKELPAVFTRMQQLDLSIADLNEQFRPFTTKEESV